MATVRTRSACGKKNRRGKVSFTAKDRKGIVEDWQVRDYEDVVESSDRKLTVTCRGSTVEERFFLSQFV